MTGTLSSGQAELVTSFLGGLGVNTHISYTDGEYATLSLIISDLQYLGITEVRDNFNVNGSSPLSRYINIAQAGIKLDLIVSGTSTAALLTELGEINQLEAAVPGSVVAIEGPNEINNFGFTFNGTGGLQGALNMQAQLYADVQADPSLAGAAVVYFTGYGNGTISRGPDPVTSGLAAYDNQHPYPVQGEAPSPFVKRSTALPNTTIATEPAVYTETGYSTDNVNQDVQAEYTLDLLLDTAQQGISKTYLYDLMDAYAPGSRQGDDGYGLFGYTKTPKAAATDIHNLTWILEEDAGAGTVSQGGTLAYSLRGLPADGNSMVFEEANGDFILALWAEPQIWNSATSTEVAAPTEAVTVSLGSAFSSVLIFEPNVGTVAIGQAADVSTLTVALIDHPVLIELSDDPPCFAEGTRILTPLGDVAVEDLAVGDCVITQGGEEAKIVWIGRRFVDVLRHKAPEKVRPVQIAAGAFGAGMPARALMLSPDHAVYFEGMLIPAKALVDGAGVRQVKRDSVMYYHVELAAHAVIFAEGLAVESYLDTGNRGAFENGGGVVDLHPEFGQARREGLSCAPFVEAGPVVARARARRRA